MTLIKAKDIIHNIILRGKCYCICCFRTQCSLISMSLLKLKFVETFDEKTRFWEMLDQLLPVSNHLIDLNTNESRSICMECANAVIQCCQFQKSIEASYALLANIIESMETSLKEDFIVLLDGKLNLHINVSKKEPDSATGNDPFLVEPNYKSCEATLVSAPNSERYEENDNISLSKLKKTTASLSLNTRRNTLTTTKAAKKKKIKINKEYLEEEDINKQNQLKIYNGDLKDTADSDTFCNDDDDSGVSHEQPNTKESNGLALKCNYCGCTFDDEYILVDHTKLCEVAEKPFKCNSCENRFSTEDKLNFHKRKHFPKCFECEYCSRLYWTKGELNMHMKKTHRDKLSPEMLKNKVYQCTKCPKDLTSKKELISHAKTHSDNEPHLCRTCNVTYKSKVNFYSHIRRHNAMKDKTCPICLKSFTKYTIKTHLKTHSTNDDNKEKTKESKSEKSVMCDICGQLVSSEKSLEKHRETHKEQKQCPECLKFVNHALFDKHRKKHQTNEPERTFKRIRKKIFCPKCDYSSPFAECLEAHENRFHLKIRPFQCSICSKSFFAKVTLKEHIKIHSGEKPEQCDTCGNRFVNKKALKLHVRLHTGEKPYTCEICNESFLSASRRQAHRIRKHFEPTVQCPVCLKMYYTQSAVRLHVRDCHSDGPRLKNNKRKTDS